MVDGHVSGISKQTSYVIYTTISTDQSFRSEKRHSTSAGTEGGWGDWD